MKKQIVSALVLAAVTLTGCSKESITSPTDGENFSLSIASPSSVQKTGGALTIESAKILVKNIKFHQFPSDNGVDVKVGPFAVTLNLNGPVHQVAASNVPVGKYDRIRFRLHKPEDFEPIPDQEFREGESGQLRYSVIVRGTYNGQSFVFKSRQNASQEIRLTTPLSVTNDEIVNVTLVVDPESWFVRNGQALDPTVPGNAQTIDDAIKASFSAGFKDNDRNGRPD
ncbi:MAG: hypothetical protein KF749_01635 [Bacteroidetes bacterium]|nr:hypothetical protein [Bacteroidota bacterium]MCW5896215.1 hypothetical protein [Bacteroidota bacterium]